jgi:SAM-dependent methyltransferase
MDPRFPPGYHLSRPSEQPPQPTDGNHPSKLLSPLDQPTDARARLLSHFQSAKGTTEHGQKWDDLWKEGFLPWDKGFPNPALVDLLTERQDLFPPPPKSGRRKALVPGCGKGYDVLLLSAFGYDAYGLEISSNALEAARRTEKEMDGKGDYEMREGVEKGRVTWLAGDFFADAFLKDVEGEGAFDLIYDYTVSLFPHRTRSSAEMTSSCLPCHRS